MLTRMSICWKIKQTLTYVGFILAGQANLLANEPDHTLIWQNRVGTSAAEAVFGLARTNSGGYVCLAHTDGGDVDKDDASNGEHDLWLIAVDANGDLDWEKGLGGDKSEFARDIIQTADNGHLIGALSYSGISGDKSEAALGSEDVWLVKLDASGDITWQATIGGSGGDYIESLHQNDDGTYMILGSTHSTDGDVSAASKGQVDVWLVKVDTDGSVLWDKRYGGDKNDWGRDIAVLSNGNYVIAADSNSGNTGDFTEGLINDRDYWAVCVDTDGDLVWQSRLGGDDNDTATSITVSDENVTIIGGRSASGVYSDRTVSQRGVLDFWVVALDSTGTTLWDAAYGGDSYDNLYDLQIADRETLVLVGNSFGGMSGDVSEASRGTYDYWFVRADLEDGSQLWDKRYGGDNFDECYDLIVNDDGTYVAVGKAASSASGDITEGYKGAGGYDVWFIKFDDGPWNPVRDQTISFTGPSNQTYAADTIPLSATSDSGLPISYSIIAGPATISQANPSEIVLTGTGTVIVAADQVGDNEFNPAAQVQQSFIVTAKEVMITGLAVSEKVYDGTTNASATGGTLTGLINNDDVSFASGDSMFADANVGSHAITHSDFTLTGPDAGNYTLITQPTSPEATITPARLTVAAADAFKQLGNPNPTWEATYEGFVTGENEGHLIGSLSLDCAATTASPVGSYAINPSGYSSTNYDIVFVSGTLAIWDASLNDFSVELTVAAAAGNLSASIDGSDAIVDDAAGTVSQNRALPTDQAEFTFVISDTVSEISGSLTVSLNDILDLNHSVNN